ncbi:MAG: RNase adapter RapZ [Actinobacteria bacterium]|nr:RNase adapter RapZ [Actinomycetota bacterium]
MDIMIVTGMSGAGKTEALKCLEDLGFYSIDNLPASLLPDVADLSMLRGESLERIALVMDIRGGGSFETLYSALKELRKKDIQYRIIFLDASDDVLVRRFSETRRIHPLGSEGLRVIDTISEERKLLEKLFEIADIVIDTSDLNIYELRDRLKAAVPDTVAADTVKLALISFGYKFGLPLDADIIIDLRFLPNPYWVEELKDLNGLDSMVVDYIMDFESAKEFVRSFVDLIESLIPLYQFERKYHLTIGVGCTGGKHRSIVIANELASSLTSDGFQVAVTHRDIDKR